MLRLMVSAFLLAAAPASAQDYALGDLRISGLYAPASIGPAKTAAGYFEVTNTGSDPDRLSAVSADFAMTMIHATEITDGVARMPDMGDGVEIPPGETLVLAPGAMHVMFMGLDAPLLAGESRRITLEFERAGSVTVDLPVR